MPDTTLTLGGYVFRDFAVPPKIMYGGKQRLQVHRIIGAGHVIDALGPEPDPIQWEGRFRGAGANAQSQALNAMRSSGAQLPLTWGGNFYMVVINHYEASYERFYEIPYKISCTVIIDPADGAFGILGSLTSLVQSDLAALQSLGGQL